VARLFVLLKYKSALEDKPHMACGASGFVVHLQQVHAPSGPIAIESARKQIRRAHRCALSARKRAEISG
jgi:hypothetical protein